MHWSHRKSSDSQGSFPPLLPTLDPAPDKHGLADLPLVPFVIINLMCLTAWCLHESEIQVQGKEAFLSCHFAALSQLSHSPLTALSQLSHVKKNLWDQGTLSLTTRNQESTYYGFWVATCLLLAQFVGSGCLTFWSEIPMFSTGLSYFTGACFRWSSLFSVSHWYFICNITECQ